MKHCKRCGETKPLREFGKNRSEKDGLSFYCYVCKREIERKQRCGSDGRLTMGKRKRLDILGIKWRESNPEKVKASAKLRSKIQSGHIKRQPCEVCGNPKSHGHHEDYSKPLDVIWLCISHHQQHHAETLAQTLGPCP